MSKGGNKFLLSSSYLSTMGLGHFSLLDVIYMCDFAKKPLQATDMD